MSGKVDAAIVIGRCGEGTTTFRRNSREGELRIPTGKLAIAEAGLKCDLVSRIGGDFEPVVNGVCGARRYESRVYHSPARPGIALVNGIPMGIHLERTIKMGTLLHWTFAVVFHSAAPEQNSVFVVGGLQFQPGIVCVDSASGEEVTHFSRAHDDFHQDRVAATNGWRDPG